MRKHGGEEGPHPVDVRVGRQLSHRRKLLGLTEQKLAEALGLTVQEVREHETGLSPITASRLLDLARLLGVSIGYFFGKSAAMDSGPRNGPAPTRRKVSGPPDCETGAVPLPVYSTRVSDIEPIDANDIDDGLKHLPSAEEVWRLVRQFSRIADPDLRATAIDQMTAMAEHRPVPLNRDQR